MNKKLVATLIASMMAISTVVSATVPTQELEAKVAAFPGAEGGGKFTSGGRGQEVYIVDTLEDYEPKKEKPILGSLRDALSKDNRTVVFNVSGTIELKAKLDMTKRKNITIAGQTAPGDGITVSGWETNISDSENIIIRYIRFRPGAANVHAGDSMDAIWGRSMKNIMIDHISTSWSTDETMSLYRAENMTVQWSMISESLTMSGHTKGRHGYGGIWGGVNTTFHHNLIANHTSRNPRMGGGTPEKDDNDHIAKFDIRNNVIYNWGFNTIYGGGRSDANFINNYLKAGPGTRENVEKRVIDAGEKDKPGKFYVNGNYLVNEPEITADNSKGIYVSEQAAPTTEVVSAPFEMEGNQPENLGLQTAQEAYEEVLGKAGATLPRRDALDARVIEEVRSGTGRYVNKDYEVGGLPVTTSEKRPDDFDKDRDGIADTWELTNGLDPTNSEDSKELAQDGSGWTNLENYMNSLVDMNHMPENPQAKLVSPQMNEIFKAGHKVTVKVETADKDGVEKVEFYNGKDKIGEDLVAPYALEVPGLTDGTYFISAKAIDKKGNATQTSASIIYVNDKSNSKVWQSKDVGTPGVAGNTSVNEDGSVTVKGSGKLQGIEDSFHFAYQKLKGDGEIVVKLDSVTAVDNHAFSGVMIRESLDVDAPTAAVGLSWVKSSSFKVKDPETGKDVTIYRNPWSIYFAGRDTKGKEFDELSENLDTPEAAAQTGVALQHDIPFKDYDKESGYYMKLNRTGNQFTAYTSKDGENWDKLGERMIEMGENVYIGLAVDANKVANEIDNLNTAKFSNISINNIDLK